jgi:hypothetical protein
MVASLEAFQPKLCMHLWFLPCVFHELTVSALFGTEFEGRYRVHSPQQSAFMLACFDTIAPPPQHTMLCNLSRMFHANRGGGGGETVPRFIHIPPHGRLITARRCSQTTRKQLTAPRNFLFYFFLPITAKSAVRSPRKQ